MEQRCIKCGKIVVITTSAYCTCPFCGTKYKCNGIGSLEIQEDRE